MNEELPGNVLPSKLTAVPFNVNERLSAKFISAMAYVAGSISQAAATNDKFIVFAASAVYLIENVRPSEKYPIDLPPEAAL